MKNTARENIHFQAQLVKKRAQGWNPCTVNLFKLEFKKEYHVEARATRGTTALVYKWITAIYSIYRYCTG
jgi:hypothetical protein